MTKTRLNRRDIVALGASSVLAALSGCATSAQGLTAAPGDQVELMQRAKTFWDHVKRNDKINAWAFEAASRDPQSTIEGYIKKGGIVYNAVDVRAVKSVSGDDAVVLVWADFALPLLRVKSQKAEMEDHWRRIDGVWYHAPKRSALFPS